MSSTQDLLRLAAEEFAARVYEIVRAEVRSEVRMQLARIGALPGEPAPEVEKVVGPKRRAKESPVQRVLGFVEQHPGAMPKDIVAALRLGRPTVFKALAEACASGVLGKRGGGRTVQYFVGSVPAPVEATVVAREPRAAVGAWREVAERVIAFVAAHPGCRYGAIQSAVTATAGVLQRALRDAKERGAIRMEGTRIKARYFAGAAAAPEPVAPAPVAPQPAPKPAVVVPPLPADERARAETMLRELEDSLTDEMHAIRLGAVLQAVVAHVRWLQERVGQGDPLSPRLDYAIRRITAVRAEKDLPFITGLKRGATADWEALARRARARVDEFDADASEVPHDRPSRVAKRPARDADEKVAPEQVQSFPALQQLTQTSPLVLVGGIKKNEVLFQVEQRYGLSVEWTAAQGANARAVEAFVERVKHGKLGAVVILEGLFGHSQVTPIVQALKAHDIPFAYGDRAGTESLRGAFVELEAAVASREAE